MKRIIWYAAATAIFVSSALARPAHGAMQKAYIPLGSGCGDTQALWGNANCGNLWNVLPGGAGWNGTWSGNDETAGNSAQKESFAADVFSGLGMSAGEPAVEWFPGQGPNAGGNAGSGNENLCPGGSGQCVDGASQCSGGNSQCPDGDVQWSDGNDAGIEWFPGQGPNAGGNAGSGNENLCPGGSSQCFDGNSQCPSGNGQCAGGDSQCPGTNGQYSDGDVQWSDRNDAGIEWFPGQGPSAGNSAGGNSQWSDGNSQCPNGNVQWPDINNAGAEWFPGQCPSTDSGAGNESQYPDGNVQWPGTDGSGTGWFPWFPNIQGWPDIFDQWQSWQGDGQSNAPDDTPNNTPSVPGTGGTSSYVSRIVELVNQERAAAGLSPVAESAQLTAAANIRAREIVSLFSHNRPNGNYFNSVLNDNHISYRKAGENIAYGYDTPERVMSEWMNSPSHRANILTGTFTEIGIGYYQDANGTKYWTQLFTY